MILTQLKLQNFRNYGQAEVSFHTGNNVLYGRNGQGKTNILESIYYLALTKSFRTNNDKNLIISGKEFFRVWGELQTVQGRVHTCSIGYSSTDGKRLTYNGQKILKFSDYIGEIPVVLLAPSDLEISQNGPHKRRQFLDIMLSQAGKLYLHHLLQYRRSLKQRNALLQTGGGDKNLLESWEESLIQNGIILINKRIDAVETLNKFVKKHYQELSGGQDKVKIIYKSSLSLNSPAGAEPAYRAAFEKNRERDLLLGSTSIGPHRDDVLFLINGEPLRNVGSQGEHKTFVIALKMAEFDFLQDIRNEPPILLFDDIFGELDAGRISNMIGSLSQIGQVFITTTSPHFFYKVKEWEGETFFHEIVEGTVSKQEKTWQKQSN